MLHNIKKYERMRIIEAKSIEGLRKTVLELVVMLGLDASKAEKEIKRMSKKTLVDKFVELKQIFIEREDIRIVDILIQNCKDAVKFN